MRMLIVGAGSTGGFFGGRLMQAGRDVTFLVREGRAKQLREHGLRIASPHGDATLQPKIVTAGSVGGRYDVVLLTVKGFQLDAVLDALAPAVGPDTMILSVLNGMQHMDVLSSRFTPRNVVGCVLKVATVIEDDGRIVHLSPMQDLAYGELNGVITPRLEALHAFMKDANIGARLSQTIGRELWEKWILLSSLGAITCLMRGTVGDIEACPGGSQFALRLFDEVVRTVHAVGVPPSTAFLDAARVQLTAKGSGFASSMYRDVLRNRPIEVENIVGDLVRRAEMAQIDTPMLSTAYVHLSVYQNRVIAASQAAN